MPWAAYGGPWRQKIGYQAWIAAYGLNWDAWTGIRRLGYPNVDSASPPLGAHGGLPLRLTYPVEEQTNNTLHWRNAVSHLPGGQDLLSAKLWWMQP